MLLLSCWILILLLILLLVLSLPFVRSCSAFFSFCHFYLRLQFSYPNLLHSLTSNFILFLLSVPDMINLLLSNCNLSLMFEFDDSLFDISEPVPMMNLTTRYFLLSLLICSLFAWKLPFFPFSYF